MRLEFDDDYQKEIRKEQNIIRSKNYNDTSILYDNKDDEPLKPPEKLLVSIKELERMIEHNADVTNVDTSRIKNMDYLFLNNKDFNQDISNWNVSNVKSMRSMFKGATSFNQDIGKWSVRNVLNMKSMFQGATSFNQDITNWYLNPLIENMSFMFQGATSFNQDIGKWSIKEGAFMLLMLDGATSFKQDTTNLKRIGLNIELTKDEIKHNKESISTSTDTKAKSFKELNSLIFDKNCNYKDLSLDNANIEKYNDKDINNTKDSLNDNKHDISHLNNDNNDTKSNNWSINDNAKQYDELDNEYMKKKELNIDDSNKKIEEEITNVFNEIDVLTQEFIKKRSKSNEDFINNITKLNEDMQKDMKIATHDFINKLEKDTNEIIDDNFNKIKRTNNTLFTISIISIISIFIYLLYSSSTQYKEIINNINSAIEINKSNTYKADIEKLAQNLISKQDKNSSKVTVHNGGIIFPKKEEN